MMWIIFPLIYFTTWVFQAIWRCLNTMYEFPSLLSLPISLTPTSTLSITTSTFLLRKKQYYLQDLLDILQIWKFKFFVVNVKINIYFSESSATKSILIQQTKPQSKGNENKVLLLGYVANAIFQMKTISNFLFIYK